MQSCVASLSRAFNAISSCVTQCIAFFPRFSITIHPLDHTLHFWYESCEALLWYGRSGRDRCPRYGHKKRESSLRIERNLKSTKSLHRSRMGQCFDVLESMLFLESVGQCVNPLCDVTEIRASNIQETIESRLHCITLFDSLKGCNSLPMDLIIQHGTDLVQDLIEHRMCDGLVDTSQ